MLKKIKHKKKNFKIIARFYEPNALLYVQLQIEYIKFIKACVCVSTKKKRWFITLITNNLMRNNAKKCIQAI